MTCGNAGCQEGSGVALLERFVIGADTVVVLDNQILGKPADLNDAVAMLRRLQGKSHRVYTGVAWLMPGGEIIVDHEKQRFISNRWRKQK